jgi:hypothetical protein
MKILNQTMIVFVVINLLTAGFALAQTPPTPAEPAPTPATATFSASNVNEKMDDLLVNVSVPSPGRGLFGSSRANSVLVIPNQEIKAEEILKINEDINVMSRIFVEKLSQERLAASSMSWAFAGSRGMTYGFPSFFGRDGSTTGSMYLQGYGALFLMKVDFPLSAPPEVEKEEEEKEQAEKEDVDQVWQQTREQMYEPQETSRRRRGRTEREEVKYEPEKVENLKTTLIKALKHATNIRILKPDESVVISITGSGSSSNKIVNMIDLPGTDQTLVIQEKGGKKATKIYTGGLPEDIEFSSPTVFVIRAKKSDIDSFAKGDLNLNNFRDKVQILSYPLLGGNTAGTSDLILPTVQSTGRR